jgi:D-alanyl-D-alanine carboxypeptidase
VLPTARGVRSFDQHVSFALSAVIAALAFAIFLAASSPAFARQQAYLVMDAQTGTVIDADNADTRLYPASLTKMMTLYLAFDALDRKLISLNQRLPVSSYAASMPPTKLGLLPGDTIRVEDAILGLVTKSANDASVVLAEALGGSEANFARIMTERARGLGMDRTTFRNANGLPDPDQMSTARDMATLGRALITDYPKYYPYFSTAAFTYKGTVFGNHNRLMSWYQGMDGIKTGFINASGFNLVASAVRDGRRLVGVVFGGSTAAGRDQVMAKLLDGGFERAGPLMVAQNDPSTAYERRHDRFNLVRSASAASPSGFGSLGRADGQGDDDNGHDMLIQRSQKPVKVAGFMPSFRAPKGLAKDPRATKGDWAIQIGSFSSATAGNQALAKAAKSVPNLLSAAAKAVAPIKTKNGTLYRARFTGLSATAASGACAALGECMTIAP